MEITADGSTINKGMHMDGNRGGAKEDLAI
jgi:hypothetical protein